MNRGYAFGFLIVVLVVVLGLYVAFTGFTSSREALRAQPASPSSTEAVQATRPPTSSPPTATTAATIVAIIPTPIPGLTATLAAMVPTEAVASPAPTKPSLPTATNPPSTQPTIAPTPAAQPPTPVSAPAYQFRVAGPPAPDPNYPGCCYIYGTIRDAAGNGLEGVQVQISNEWNPPVLVVSKGGVDLGNYDIPIGRDLITWYIILVDAAGSQISTQVQIQFDPNAGNAYRVDWQRTY